MKKICPLLILGILVLSGFGEIAAKGLDEAYSKVPTNSSQRDGNTLITEDEGDRVIEVDIGGTIVWEITGLDHPADAERLVNGNTLIIEYPDLRVIEVDSGGNVVWQKTGLQGPIDAERLDNGNTLITENNGDRIIEVDNGGNVVWQKTGLYDPYDAERLDNGNTLIADGEGHRVIEIDSNGTIVWQKTGLIYPVDVERLDNGNTLITEHSDSRIIEVDNGGFVVWEITGLDHPADAERLDNGNTLIADRNGDRVIEVDSNGTIVWQKTGLGAPVDAERITTNEPPNAPVITGPESGKVGTEYEYNFTATDLDGDNVKYYIDWGDGNTEWTGFSASGTLVTVSHIWASQDTYTITALAQDEHGLDGPEGTLVVSMPVNQQTPNSWWFLQFLQNHPHLFPILRYILGL